MKTIAEIQKLKSGGFILIDGEPCRIEKVQTSSSGKHGHTKVRVEGTGLLDEKRRSMVKPSGEKVDVPIVNKKIAQVLAIVGDRAQLMDMETYDVFELPIPQDLKGKLKEGGETNYFEVVGTKTLKQIK